MKARRLPMATFVSALLLLGGVRAALADVRDNAGFFSEDAVRQANFDLRDVKQKYGKDLLVETYPAVPAELQSQLDAAALTGFTRVQQVPETLLATLPELAA